MKNSTTEAQRHRENRRLVRRDIDDTLSFSTLNVGAQNHKILQFSQCLCGYTARGRNDTLP